MTQQSWLQDAIRGGIAGGIATVGMTAAMMIMHRRLPPRERYGLPPEQIVDEVLERAEAEDSVSSAQFETLTMTIHHGYGATMGAAYGALAPRLQLSPLAGGAGFGMVVWAIGYLGWMPALQMDASATREPMRRNALTIVSHLVWGSLTGLLTARQQQTSQRVRASGQAVRGRGEIMWDRLPVLTTWRD